jgi:Zn-dependent M28 family amino/carboxypeptidase
VRRSSLFLLPLALLALAACAAEPPPLPPPAPTAAPAPPPLAVAADPAAAARIAADVTYLASPELAGRGTGDPGGRAAADFVLKRFRDLGLAPAAAAAGAAPEYLQPFQARVGAKVVENQIEVSGKPIKAAARERGARDAERVIAAAGSASEAASAAAVFVGHGLTASAVGWDDYAGADVTGKIVIVLDGVPTPADATAKPGEKPPANPLRDFGGVRYKLRTAREHKAAGVVIVAADDKLPAAPDDPSSMGVPGVVVARSLAKQLFPALKLDDKKTWEPGKAVAARPLAKNVTVRLSVKIEPLEATSWNVVGVLPARAGSPHADEVVVVGAHYDHLGMGNQFSRAPGVHAAHPGADDNASGTALMLEVARRFAGLADKPDRRVLFMAFGAEEVGAVGSRFWTQHPTVPLDKIVAMLNADMVGRMQKDHVVIDGVGTSPAWRPIVEGAAQGLGLDIALGGEGFGASDHASFTAVRVPVAFFFTGVHPDYHMPSDTADKIDSAGEERIATLVGRMTLAVAQAEGRLPFVDAPADPHQGGRGGFKVSLGTVPDYAYTGKGLRLDGVRADSPAARAGLARGDVIVKVGSHDVGNIHDYMFALGELEPGRKVVIEVERDGKRVPLEAIPAPGK